MLAEIKCESPIKVAHGAHMRVCGSYKALLGLHSMGSSTQDGITHTATDDLFPLGSFCNSSQCKLQGGGGGSISTCERRLHLVSNIYRNKKSCASKSIGIMCTVFFAKYGVKLKGLPTCPNIFSLLCSVAYSSDIIVFQAATLNYIEEATLNYFEEVKGTMNIALGPLKTYLLNTNATNFQDPKFYLLNTIDTDFHGPKCRISFSVDLPTPGIMGLLLSFSHYLWPIKLGFFSRLVHLRKNDIYESVNNLKWQMNGINERQYMNGDSTEGTDCNSEFRYVLCSNLDDMKLLYNAKLDCVDPEKYEGDLCDKGSFMKVNCCLEPTGSQMKKKFLRNKTGQAWIANHLGGVPRVVFGFRTYDFIVNTLKLFNTEDLPEMGKDYWTPNGCMNFLNTFLKYVKTIAHKHPGKVIEFEKEKHVGRIRWKVLEVQNMLPTWYTDNLFGEQQQTI
ncbi:unnamed protein product, partial [Meganyctiphanes norvegica]